MKRDDRHPEINAHIASFIKSRRTELRLSLDELAERMGCSKSHIWDLEKGNSTNPSLWMIIGLCDGLRCSLNSLIGKDVSQPIFTNEELALIDAHRRIFKA